jgi:hypothetical protein
LSELIQTFLCAEKWPKICLLLPFENKLVEVKDDLNGGDSAIF